MVSLTLSQLGVRNGLTIQNLYLSGGKPALLISRSHHRLVLVPNIIVKAYLFPVASNLTILPCPIVAPVLDSFVHLYSTVVLLRNLTSTRILISKLALNYLSDYSASSLQQY